jgi:12-oxophytodienoic acid reductase
MPDGSRGTCSKPRALAMAEISEMVDQFRRAARNAKSAGFDGVEIHGAHGYLIDQFLKDGINDRSDEYGGSIENRCRFAHEIVEAVAEEIGAESTAVRLSPIIDHNGATDSDPLALTHHLIRVLNRYPLAYLHVTEPRFTREGLKQSDQQEADNIAAEMWSIVRGAYRGVLMRSGGYVRESGMEAVSKGHADLISFGRLFISNPDLPLRFAIDAKHNEYDRSTFYTHHQVVGYTDYPFYINSLTANATPNEI